ncbi:gonadotropin-releasing hormone receptor [Plodia interpunctella]|uniref:gonadotropin-releasing hormone receptor n=1 Tax=Plodia interpunctella TaxID=58824 RepID=UPI0023689054|nr:gonadotropin-releasing hormone receptor [Plodia interpunctella]XP_053611427.1 gonadotropin-releasing hormone receptor [Plodia interpunctella]XP_053611428.1 gonadotropin-releasing hormone receptor [Plodia interpunctella]
MESADNNITSYDDLIYPSELSLQREFITKDTAGNITWPIEKCIKNLLIDQKTDDITNRNFMYNGTLLRCLDHAPVMTKSTIIRASVLSAMALLSLFGNIATIISLKRGKRSRGRARPSWTAIYSLIFQLSIADLLVTVFCIAGEAAWSFTVQWYAGNIACKLFKFLQMFALYLSTFILVLIGVDRWLAVKYPMKSMATATRSGRLVIIAWVLSFLFSIPQIIVFRVAKGPFVEEFYQCVTYGFYTERWQEQAYTTLSLIFMFILPLVILVSTYVSTVRTIAKSEKVFKPEVIRHEKYLTPDMNRRRLIDRAKMKSLRMSVVIVAAFIIWWTPYYIMMIIFNFLDPDKDQSEELLSGIFFFGMSNSLVNPVIYGAFHLWPRKKPSRHSDRESGGNHASLLRRGDHTSSVRLTTIRSLRSSAKYSNGHNVSLL